MSSTEDSGQLDLYEAQLSQVREAIKVSSGEDAAEMRELEENLLQLIDITKQSILEKQKIALLQKVDELATDNVQNVEEEAVFKAGDVQNVEEEAVFKAGDKCLAPFKSTLNGLESLHNAVIFADEAGKAMRVVFINPVEVAMVPCPFFLEGRCKFEDDQCRFSHGEVVHAQQLRPYVKPNHASLREGSRVLAKSKDKQTWEHASIDMVSSEGVLVKWNAESSIEHLSFSDVLPLGEQPVEQINNQHQQINQDDLLLQIDPSADKLGGWERYTRGMGSRLMAKMGYVFGQGLGKQGEGRVEPVPTLVFPAGRSLDWIHDNHQKMKTVEENCKAKQDHCQTTARSESTFFDLLNSACRSNQSVVKKNQEAKEKSSDTLNVQGFHVTERMKLIRREIGRLERSALQHKSAGIQAKLASLKSELAALQGRSSQIEKGKDVARERLKLTKF